MNNVRVRGHFGEYLQGRLGPDGPLGLVTVPCSKTGLHAQLRCRGREATNPLAGFLRALGLADWGEVVISPLSPPGAGTGISTARLIAAARLHGWQGPTGRLMAACVAEEGASDPLAFAHPERLLWASREGRILKGMPPIPAHDILGGYFGAPRSTDPADMVFPDVSDIVAGWQKAGKLHAFAELASESARRCLRTRGPADDPTEELSGSLGALGFVIAHTGSARGLIFPKGRVPPCAAPALEAAGITGVLQFASDDR